MSTTARDGAQPGRSATATAAGLRLVHNVSAISEEASGPSYSVVRLCGTLAEQGHDVTLLTLDWAPMKHVPGFCRTFPMGAGPRRLGRSPAMHRWLSQHAEGVDVVHTHGMWMMTNVYPGRVAARHGIPLVVSPRGTFTRYALASGSRLKKVFWPLLQRPAIATAACFHATAEAEYEDIRRLGFRQPVAVVPNGIDLEPLAPRRRGGRRSLLFLARIHPNKGLDLLLPAWARVAPRFPEWDLRIVGSDHGYHGTSGHLDEMKALAGRLGLERVSFEGPQHGADKHAAYRDADLYVLPSYSENFGVTVAEALSQETPAIVTRGAPWEGLVASRAGWWVDIGVEPLAAALASAMATPPATLRDMGANGRRWMEREFLWHSTASQMADVYRWLRDPMRPRPACVRIDQEGGRP